MMNDDAPPPVTGVDLIDWGHRPGPAFPGLLARANAARGQGLGLLRIRQMLEADLSPPAPEPLALQLPGAVPLHVSIRAETADEQKNLADVLATMAEVLKTPTVEAGAVMPDACPAGPLGTIPGWADYAEDATGLTLIPLNMAEPVLVVRGRDAGHALGFAPHGAGRNFSRSEHRRRMGAVTPAQMLAAEAQGLDIRFHAGAVDASELPSSYKRAGAVMQQIADFGLADVVDCIDPYGCIMAGDQPPFWQTKRSRR